MADSNLNDLCAALQPIANEFLRLCNLKFTTHIIVTYRDAGAQSVAYDKGLSNAKAGQSPHNCCLTDGSPASKAFDFAIFESDGAYVTNGQDDRYTLAGMIGEGLGLTWGGRRTTPDYDHLEMKNWKTG